MEDLQRHFDAAGNKANRVSFKRWVKFLSESARIAWEDAEAMGRFLKNG